MKNFKTYYINENTNTLRVCSACEKEIYKIRTNKPKTHGLCKHHMMEYLKQSNFSKEEMQPFLDAPDSDYPSQLEFEPGDLIFHNFVPEKIWASVFDSYADKSIINCVIENNLPIYKNGWPRSGLLYVSRLNIYLDKTYEVKCEKWTPEQKKEYLDNQEITHDFTQI